MIGRKPNLPNASIRRCLVCGIEKPLTADNFQIVPFFANGFSFYCNDCDLESRKQKTFTREEFKLDIVEVSAPTYYRWQQLYGGMKATEAKRLKELELENTRLKRLLADAELDKAMLKELAEGNF